MPSYPNPFAQAQQIDQGMRALAKGFFSGPSPNEEAERAALIANRQAQTTRAAAQTTKAQREAEEIARRLSFTTPEALDESVATSFGVPSTRVRAVRSIPGGPSPTGMPPAVDPMARQLGERLFALRAALATGKGGAGDIALADERFAGGRAREGVMAGELDPTIVGQAYFSTSGKAPFDFTREGTGNLGTGEFTMSSVGEATAGKDRAQGDKARQEALNLSRGFFGPQTFIEDETGVVTPRFLGEVAGRNLRAGARPVAPKAGGGAKLRAENAAIDRALLIAGGIGDDTVKVGTGPMGASRAALDAVIGGLAPGDWRVAPETQDARQRLREFRQVAILALANNPRIPVAEQQRVLKMVPDPDAIIRNPAQEAANLRSVVGLLRRIRQENERTAGAGAPRAQQYPIGSSVVRGGQSYVVVGHDIDGEPLVDPE